MSLYRKHLTDLLAYITGRSQFNICRAALTGSAYPVDLEFALQREDEFYYPKDANGLPIRVYRSVGAQYNPTRVASYALAHFNRWALRDSRESQRIFLKAANWFLAAEDAVWRYRYDWNGLRAPWLSCMAQGQGISVLTRAYEVTGDGRYLDHARTALIPLTVPVSAGGVRSRLDDRSDFLEEYPSTRPVHVLNGFLFALMGIADLARIDPGIKADVGESDLVAALRSNVERWDVGFWSAYDLSKGPRGVRNITTMSYHQLHVTQLHYLAAVHCCRILADVAERWQALAESVSNRMRAMAGKVTYRLVVPTQR